jgi:hypothetical protein
VATGQAGAWPVFGADFSYSRGQDFGEGDTRLKVTVCWPNCGAVAN